MPDFLTPPDPSGSPLEKLELSRRTPNPRDLGRYLRMEGIDEDTARRMASAVEQWEREKFFDEVEGLQDLQTWANIHTHPGGGDGGGGGSLPTGIFAHYDASEFALSEGATIPSWPDSSGNGRDLSTVAGSPTYTGSGVGGQPSVEFNGSASIRGAFAASITQPNTVLVVGQFSPSTQRHAFVDGISGSERHHLFTDDVVSAGDPTYVTSYAGASLNGTVDAAAEDVGLYLTAVMNGASSLVRTSGQEVTGNAGSHPLGGLRIGANYLGNLGLVGYVGEVVLYDRALDATEIGEAESYLRSKYGL